MSVDLALERMRPIDGWLTENEARLLYRCAIQAAPLYWPIVEVGSYLGRSTVVLATAAEEAHMLVFAVDPHQGILSGPNTEPTFERFARNVLEAGCTNVAPIVQPSTDVDWFGEISLLFIDALHDYDSVRADTEHFMPHLAPGGMVAFHDYGTPEPWGVTRYVDGLLEGDWRKVGRADSAIAIEKRP